MEEHGGSKLLGLSSLGVDNKSLFELSKNKKKLEEEIKQLNADLDKHLMPKDGSTQEEKRKITKERNVIRKTIKSKERELEKLISKNKEMVAPDDFTRLNNLAKRVNHPVKDFGKIDALEFIKEKKNLLYKAAKHYERNSEYATKGIVILSAAVDKIPICNGYNKMISDNTHNINVAVNEVLIDMGMQDIGIEKFLNPYLALGLALGGPLLATVIVNSKKGSTPSKDSIKTDEKSKNNLQESITDTQTPNI